MRPGSNAWIYLKIHFINSCVSVSFSFASPKEKDENLPAVAPACVRQAGKRRNLNMLPRAHAWARPRLS
jgi:hypothetical protein